MKKILSLTAFLFFLSLSSLMAASNPASALKYSDDKCDIFMNVNIEELVSFFEKSGIDRKDIPSMLGSSADKKTGEFERATGISIFDIKNAAIAASTESVKFEDTSLIVFSVDEKKIPEALKAAKTTIAGKPSVSLKNEAMTSIILCDDLLVMGKKEVLEAYVSRINQKDERKDNRVSDYISEAKGRILYQKLYLSNAVKEKMKAAFERDPRTAAFIKNNPFILSMTNLDHITLSFSIGVLGGDISIGLFSGQAGDGKKLEMLSHTFIVGASLAVSALLGKDETGSDKVFQDVLMKIKTDSSDKGVKISLELNKEDGSKIAEKIKESIKKTKDEEKKKAEAAEINKAVNAAREGNLKAIEKYLEAGKDINAKTEYSETMLSAACENDKLQVVSILLKKGADPNIIVRGNITPLMEAASSGRLEVVKLLLKAGADKTTTDEYGSTAADRARDGGYTTIEKLLK